MKIKGETEYKSLLKEYRKLAKRADQRIVRLKGYRHDKGFEGILSYAYAGAQKAIRAWSGGRSERFNTAPPKKLIDLQKKIADIKRFLEAPTSTKKGIMDIYKRRTESLNKTFFGDDKKSYLTWQEWANFWDRVDADNTDSRFEYNMTARSAGLMKRYNITADNVKRKTESLIREDKIDIIEQRSIEELLKNGITPEKLFK